MPASLNRFLSGQNMGIPALLSMSRKRCDNTPAIKARMYINAAGYREYNDPDTINHTIGLWQIVRWPNSALINADSGFTEDPSLLV